MNIIVLTWLPTKLLHGTYHCVFRVVINGNIYFVFPDLKMQPLTGPQHLSSGNTQASYDASPAKEPDVFMLLQQELESDCLLLTQNRDITLRKSTRVNPYFETFLGMCSNFILWCLVDILLSHYSKL